MPTATGGIENELGVYVHIPFCSKRCGYCAFVTSVGKLDLAPDYVDACVADIGRAKKDGSLPRPTTVFVGGGTPSLLPEGSLERLLGAIDPAPVAEVTVEANPESAT
ncbi:MAG TPA: radical SAM protein, partial [Acidimicrobiales bacterium]|nr:radical SAM protein [Acidimicrobiales bacterium]